MFDKLSVNQIYKFKDKYHLKSALASTESYNCDWLFCRTVDCRGKYIFPQTYMFQIRIQNFLIPKPQSNLQAPW